MIFKSQFEFVVSCELTGKMALALVKVIQIANWMLTTSLQFESPACYISISKLAKMREINIVHADKTFDKIQNKLCMKVYGQLF